MKITIIKNSRVSHHVRVRKFISFFSNSGIPIGYILWNRNNDFEDNDEEINFLHSGGGYANKRLIVHYWLWMGKLFLHLIKRKKNGDNTLFFVIDFDSALPVYLASLIKKDINYIYDVHDDFALRYKIPIFLKKIITKIDCLVKNRADKVIHVDTSRIRECDKNYEVIYNSPIDIPLIELTDRFSSNTFVVSGLLLKTRGLESLIAFARDNPQVKLIVAGEIIDSLGKSFVSMPNVDYLGFIEQKKLFEIIQTSRGIFSLYDPTIEINRLAASNKLYDAMMLGIPVITNNGILAADLVRSEKIGYIVDYEYNLSWNKLLDISKSELIKMGNNGRNLYESTYSYKINFEDKLQKIFDQYMIQNENTK